MKINNSNSTYKYMILYFLLANIRFYLQCLKIVTILMFCSVSYGILHTCITHQCMPGIFCISLLLLSFKFIHKCLVFDAIVSKVVFFISFSDYSLLLYKVQLLLFISFITYNITELIYSF
jgi:hypothetical protein